ncbi:hypothetical protein Syun_018104 [Stephania yunnanensis]|uniref:G domain-containing protein n=1 Tax=Stephania yunnanensis TaxID=152371 RepID=A0AAP0NUP9_9MAGN
MRACIAKQQKWLFSSLLQGFSQHHQSRISTSSTTTPHNYTQQQLTTTTTTTVTASLNPSFSFTKTNNTTKQSRRNLSILCSSPKPEKLTKKRPTHQSKPPKKPLLSEGREDDESHGLICPGCGIFMQNTDPNLPGFYQNPTSSPLHQSAQIDDQFSNLEEFGDGSEGELEEMEEIDEIDDIESAGAGFAPAGIGYGNVTEEYLNKAKRERVSKAARKAKAREAAAAAAAKEGKEGEAISTVCARCHSLRHYGQVKNENAENLIPDFDFDRLITTRLMKPTSNSDSSVVVMVVDCIDFDGSFPKRAAKALFKALEGTKRDHHPNKLRLPKLVLVATKVDLLPSQVSPTRLDRWVRNRAKANGGPKLSGVYLVSARKDLGVRNLLSFIKELAGPRGNVWVIGAQNAGKSTLINAFAKKEGSKITKLTEAAVPGTTLGILRIGGVLPAKAKMYDTPGLLHPYLMSMRLNRDEQKMAEIRKELQPRTYRIKASCLRIGAKEYKVSGISWDVNGVDIAVAGLGWFSVCLKGEATLALWTLEGVDITVREPLVLDRAPFLERPGFLLPKAISDAVGNQTKLEAEKRKKEAQDSLSEAKALVTVVFLFSVLVVFDTAKLAAEASMSSENEAAKTHQKWEKTVDEPWKLSRSKETPHKSIRRASFSNWRVNSAAYISR